MISFVLNRFPVRRKLVYFSNEPSLKFGFFDNYIQSFSRDTKFGFKRFPKYTKLIDLTDNRLENSFRRTTIYQIRRAKSEGIKCRSTGDLNIYISFYNKHLYERKLPGRLSEKNLKIFGDSFIIRVAFLEENQFLVCHNYLLDRSIKRVRVLNSFSNIHDKNLTSSEKSIIGRANRLLHYDDMLYFREQGFLTYDFGGYAFETIDKSLSGINNFKDSFGGVLDEESDYEPYLVFALKVLKKKLIKLISKNDLWKE